MLRFAVMMLFVGCSESGLSDASLGGFDVGADTELRVENWADQDTNGVGTHRVVDTPVNVRSQDLNGVLFIAAPGQQLVTTRTTRDWNGHTYYEAYFRGGEFDGEYGWIAGAYLRHTVLQVCGTNAAIRTGNQLENTVGTAAPGQAAYVVSSTIRNTGSYRYFEVSVGGVQGFVSTESLCAGGASTAGGRVGLAQRLLDLHDAGEIELWASNFGRNDGASPLENVEDAAAGEPSEQSCHGNAPCGSSYMEIELLSAMVDLHDVYGFDYFVTSIVGASHSPSSYHYEGRSIDIGEVNGRVIYGDSVEAQSFMNACWEMGAIEVLGPSNDPAGHFDHLHCTF